MVLMKVVRNGKTSLNIISEKSQLSKIAENGPKMVSNNEMVLMKVKSPTKGAESSPDKKKQKQKVSKPIFLQNNCCSQKLIILIYPHRLQVWRSKEVNDSLHWSKSH